ncbi:MAG TPA: hypothetical protein ENG45_00030, partial [Candidatus Aenigmarchaeota archaeon]|nr:hypothetical protein [Candidatus Aenigmarchaeota archaeon]
PLTHPLSLELLKRDVKNINSFFRKFGISIEDDRKIYEKLIEIIEER